MKKLLLIMLCMMAGGLCYAQTINTANYPVVGKPCPDFVLRNIHYYNKTQASLADFKGKWLVLDFWNTHCGACVASFPRVSAMQKEFGDKVQFILVGIQDKENQIEPMYAKFREREHLVMPCAFDSLLANRWEIITCPHVIIIDDQGMVRAITSSYHREDMAGFLSGNPPQLDNPFRYDWEKDTRVPFDKNKPFLVNGNGGNDSAFLFRSLLSKYDGTVQGVLPRALSQDSARGRFQILRADLTILYNYAYYGAMWPDSGYHFGPVLEIKDSTLFRYNSYNQYCYSLILPPKQARTARMQKIMQRDLQNYFGYEARIEERKFPCWHLVATEEAKRKLRTKGGPLSVKELPHTGLIARNLPFAGLLSFIFPAVPDPVTDDTGITGNIDIAINWIDTDFESVKKALHEKGLDLIREDRPMKVLVIKDPSTIIN